MRWEKLKDAVPGDSVKEIFHMNTPSIFVCNDEILLCGNRDGKCAVFNYDFSLT